MKYSGGLSTTSNNGSFAATSEWLEKNYPGVTYDNKILNINGIRYSWQRLEDGKTLVPVLYSIHREFQHTGGWSIIQKKGLIDF